MSLAQQMRLTHETLGHREARLEQMSIGQQVRLTHETFQYGYTGHIINIPQDVISFANRLPQLLSNLDIEVIRKEGVDQSHVDLHVRRSVVHCALQWLIMNNIYYRPNHIHTDEDALAQLPYDGNLSNIFYIAVQTPPTSDQISGDDPYDAHLARSFVPVSLVTLSTHASWQETVW